MTPKRAILAECNWCMNEKEAGHRKCPTQVCNLKVSEKSHLKRIRDHCIDCIPGQSLYWVKECDNVTCNLWIFRMGKNPRNKGGNIAPNPKYYFKKTAPAKPPYLDSESKNEGQDISEVMEGGGMGCPECRLADSPDYVCRCNDPINDRDYYADRYEWFFRQKKSIGRIETKDWTSDEKDEKIET